VLADIAKAASFVDQIVSKATPNSLKLKRESSTKVKSVTVEDD